MKSKITIDNLDRKEQQLNEILFTVNKMQISTDLIPHELKISLADLQDEIQ